MYLVTKWFGVFLCNKEKIQKKILFPKDEKKIAEKLLKIERKEILPEEKEIIKDDAVIVSEKRLQEIGDFEVDNSFFKTFEIKPEDFDFSQDMLHKASIIVAKKRVDTKLRSEDLQVIQMVNALDELIQMSNLLSERLAYWSVLPHSVGRIKPIENVFSTVDNETKNLEDQIEGDMKKIAPNLCKLVGSSIGARLISLSGGLEKLALCPASTIQILGAEKAFFRFKKEGGRPPKHGIIFQHQLVNKAPRCLRGKIARTLAAKIAIATRADAFTKRDVSKKLGEDLDKCLDKIRNQ